MKRKLFAIFGPVVLAVDLLFVFFTSPYRVDISNPETIRRISSSMLVNVLKGDVIESYVLSKKQYIPFFGSSELGRISPFRPSVLAEKYQRNYCPFLLGAPGTQSLSQYMMMRSAGDVMKNKRAIFVTSPQWFIKNGIKTDYFNTYYSELQTRDWLLSMKKVTLADRYLTRKLLTFSKVKEDDTLTAILQMIKKGKLPLPGSLSQLRSQWNILKREDEVFSDIGLKDRQQKVDHKSKRLPKQYQETELSILVNQIGERETTNNPFGLKNDFYTYHIRAPRDLQLK